MFQQQCALGMQVGSSRLLAPVQLHLISRLSSVSAFESQATAPIWWKLPQVVELAVLVEFGRHCGGSWEGSSGIGRLGRSVVAVGR